MKRSFALLSLASILAFAGKAQAQTIAWDDANAALAGSGCSKDLDAFVLAAGDDLSIVFSNLGVNLSGFGDTRLADRRSCIASVRANVAPGFYVGMLTQQVSFGLVKSAGADANIGVISSFAGYGLRPLNVTIPRGRTANGELQVASRQDDFLVMSSRWCGRAIPTIYRAQLTASGRRDNLGESVVAQIDGLDVRFEATAGVYRCPL